MNKWMLLMIVLLPSVAFSQATVTGNFEISGKFQIGTNVIDQGIQAMKVPGSIVTGGGLVGAWLIPKGLITGDDPQHAGTLFDLSGNNFNLTAPVIGITNQLAYGTAGTNQVGLVGVPSVNCSTNSSLGLSRLENINGVAPLFNIPNTGITTNGGLTFVILSRPRAIVLQSSFGVFNLANGNQNRIDFNETQASPSQTKVIISSTSNSTTFVTSGMNAVVTNRWRFELLSYDENNVLTRMDNLNNSAQQTIAFGTNFTFNVLSVGLRHGSSYGNRYNGDWAGALVFTNSMNDGISRTNVLNWLNQYYNFY